jgi:hypothetical protein
VLNLLIEEEEATLTLSETTGSSRTGVKPVYTLLLFFTKHSLGVKKTIPIFGAKAGAVE